jgi:hypothetical protein
MDTLGSLMRNMVWLNLYVAVLLDDILMRAGAEGSAGYTGANRASELAERFRWYRLTLGVRTSDSC